MSSSQFLCQQNRDKNQAVAPRVDVTLKWDNSIIIYWCQVYSIPCMVAKDKINFYLLFRLWELWIHLGCVIVCVNDTLMLLLVPWLKGTFPFLLCLSSSEAQHHSSPGPVWFACSGRGWGWCPWPQGLIWVCTAPCCPLVVALWAAPSLHRTFSGLCWQKGTNISYRKSTNKETPWRL